ncbi:unnamed protein product [Linum tenue]|uniref:polynucleotide adenylyltransferase n=1 Tax=Linum tenue TaxID=586396 RepID=A0AAV0QFG7_9ROSI|nr:unnamed protein product [Linum tenue]
MDSPAGMPVPVYETLAILPLSSSAPTPPSTPTTEGPVPPQSPEPYTVLRNEVAPDEVPSACVVTSAAPEFFSLDVCDDEVEDAEFRTPSGEAESTSPVVTGTAEPVGETEPRLESGWFSGNGRFKSPLLQLHKEIVDFCDFLSPTLEEQASRRAAVESVCDVIKYIWPRCKVEVFGSFRTGLYLPTSDVDVVILNSHVVSPQTGLHALSRALSQRGIAKKILVIAKARVPIIKFVEKRSGISFDLSFDLENGPKAADFIQDGTLGPHSLTSLVIKVCNAIILAFRSLHNILWRLDDPQDAVAQWPSLRPLCLILKVFLQQRELNEVYTGGVGSYALLTMLLAVLKNLSLDRTPEHNLGVLLIHFFDLYGRKLCTSDVGISCNGFFSKRAKGFMNNGRPFLISIEDPQAPGNDIGKNSFNYFQVRSAFAMAHSTLTNPKTIFSLGPNRSILGTIIRPDPVLLQRKGGQNGDVTFNSLLPGAGEPLQSRYDHQEIMCNWQLDDEEALPRGNGGFAEDPSSSGKKRKLASSSVGRKSSKKRSKEENGGSEVKKLKDKSSAKKSWTEEKGSAKKKARWRRSKNGPSNGPAPGSS